MIPPLTNPQIRSLKAQAQRLEPILRLGKSGATAEFVQALDSALAQHELVKIKFANFKEQKAELSPELAEKTASHLVMRVGNVAVYYKPQPNPEKRQIPL